MATPEERAYAQVRLLMKELDADITDIEQIQPYHPEEPDEATKQYWANNLNEF